MRLAVLASGSGTILDAICSAGIPVAVVVVDRPCGAQEVAERHGLRGDHYNRLMVDFITQSLGVGRDAM